ncbi:MAG: tRNA (guanosine(37)-N1)-methyltransferase TrmD [Candidatus Aminicenantales bacterium]
MRFDIITIFPEMFSTIFSGGVAKKALEKRLLEVYIHDLREYTHDKHRQVDDRPFGGGEGMVLKPEPIFEAVESIRKNKRSRVFLLSPQGVKFDSGLARKLSRVPQVVLVCGRYEGVDERVVHHLVDDEISIGDYVLTGGEPAAWVVVDAVSRFIPGVVGKKESVRRDSFFDGLLDFPHFTRPRDFRGIKVPQVLFSGNHAKISDWRRRKALEKTKALRPDLLAEKKIAPEDRIILESMTKKGKDNEPD